MVCLSTTLATNAVVEGTGASVGLITIGEGIKDSFPADHIVGIRGKLDIIGRERISLDYEEVEHALMEIKTRGIETLAISGYDSVKNPIHELYVQKMAEGMP